ncbi:MAG: energy transducer TonB [Gammaproteobacteria bacterium]
MSKLSIFLRFLASGLIALAILVLGGGWIIHEYVGHDPAQTVGMTVIRNINLLSHVPGKGNHKDKNSAAKHKPTRMVPGFAQVAFTVGTDGRAHDIHVLRSAPKGVYDQAAQAVIAARHFKPPKSGHATEQTEIVHFQVPADKQKSSSDKSGAGG